MQRAGVTISNNSTTFSPLAHGAFRLLLVSSLLSNGGNAIQSVGAAWHLTATGQSADIIALVQTAFNLPIMLLALPAGAWADMFDKRHVMLWAQAGMLAASILLVLLVQTGHAPPFAIIGLTAILACGVAVFNPSLSASVRSAVPRAELAAGVALTILVFNFARSVGPALGGMLVSFGGAIAAFITNALAYLLVIAVLMRWRGAGSEVAGPKVGGPEVAKPRRRIVPVVAEGLRYAARSPQIRAILLRAASFTTAGAAAWALMPLVAADMLDEGSTTYGFLLAALGAGAVLGAASSTWLRTRCRAEVIIRVSALLYGVACVSVALQPGFAVIIALLVVAGASWVQALSGFSVAGQLWAPHEVVGRIVALVSSVTFGGIALGSWLWGHVAEGYGVAAALMASGLAMALPLLLGLIVPMPAHDDEATPAR